MSKKFLTWTLIVAFATCHSPAFIRADSSQESIEATEQSIDPSSQIEQTEQATTPSNASTQEEAEDNENPVGTPVEPTNPETQKSAKRQLWTNIIIAGVAVIVAVVSILVVSNNNGKKN